MNRPLLYYAIALLLGGLFYVTFVGNYFVGVVFAASFFIIIFYTINKKFSILIFIFFIVGAVNFHLYYNVKFYSREFEVNIVQKKDGYMVGNCKGRKVILKNIEIKNHGKNINGIDVGMRVSIKGNFKAEKVYERGIVGNIIVTQIVSVNKNGLYKIYSLREELFSNFQKKLGKDNTAFVMAICFGDTSYLSENQIYEFQKLGVIHAVSVSGFHMAVIFKIMESLVGVYFAIVISIFYVIFTGIQSPALRAVIMIIIYKISKKVKMNYDGLSSLSLSAIILYIWKPYYIFDIGFSLSYLATLGILLYNKKLQRFFYILPQKLNESISITLSAQCFSTPYMAFTLHSYSPGFFIGNLILIPIYTWVVVLGNAAAVFQLIKPIFNFLAFSINILMNICKYISDQILKITPDIIYFSTMEGIFLLVIYLIYILYKHGYKKSILLPGILFCSIMVVNLFTGPVITHFITYEGDNYIVDYGKEKLLLMSANDYSGQDIKKLNLLFKPTKFVVVSDNCYRKSIDNKLYIQAAKIIGDNTLDLKLYFKGRKIIFSVNNSQVAKNKYDIINTNDKRQNLKYINFYNMDNLSRYELLLGKMKKVN